MYYNAFTRISIQKTFTILWSISLSSLNLTPHICGLFAVVKSGSLGLFWSSFGYIPKYLENPWKLIGFQFVY